MLYLVTDSRRTWWGVVQQLEELGNIQVFEVTAAGNSTVIPAITSKAEHVRRLLSPRLLRLRKRWGRDDAVLVFGWFLLPVLVLIHLRVLTRPRKLVSMFVFVQSQSIRRVVTVLWRILTIPELEFIVNSAGEQRRLTQEARVPPERVHVVVWGANPTPQLEPDSDAAPYIFTGGYTNRDYATFFAAVRSLAYPTIAVASSLNRLPDAPANVNVRIDLPWDEFERLIADCQVLVLPLNPAGEVSGVSVLHRGMRYSRPIVVTRHDGVMEHLGENYSGYVPCEDPDALRAAIGRVMTDESFRLTLEEEVAARREFIRENTNPARDILAILES